MTKQRVTESVTSNFIVTLREVLIPFLVTGLVMLAIPAPVQADSPESARTTLQLVGDTGSLAFTQAVTSSGSHWSAFQFRAWDDSEQAATIDADSGTLTLGLPSGTVTLFIADRGVDLRLVPSSPDMQPVDVFLPAAVFEEGDQDSLLKLFEAEPVRRARIALATPEAQANLKALTDLMLDEGLITEDSEGGFVFSKDPPAEPGAFKCEPPKAALLWPLTSGIGAP